MSPAPATAPLPSAAITDATWDAAHADVVATLRDLIRIPSVNPVPADAPDGELRVARYLADRLTATRQELRDALDAQGIGTGVSYEALHLCTLGRRYGYKEGDLPVTERIARETLTLPLHAGMTVADVDRDGRVVGGLDGDRREPRGERPCGRQARR